MEVEVNTIAAKLGIGSAEIKRRMAYLGISQQDIQTIKKFGEKLGTLPKAIFDDFYDHLNAFKETREYLKNKKVVNRLKWKQIDFFMATFGGRYDLNYFFNALIVGSVNRLVGLEPKWFIGASAKFLEVLIYSLGKLIEKKDIEKTIVALIKVSLLNIDLSLSSYYFAREERILYLHRTHTVLSNINKVITSIEDRGKLFRDICHIAVAHGNFLFAWIGIADPKSGIVLPVGSYGKGDYLKTVGKICVKGRMSGGGKLTGIAIKKGEIVVRQIGRGKKKVPWEENALKHGYGSCAAVPVKIGGKPVGALTLYSAEPDSFENEEEIAMLKEIAGDLSFALDQIEKQKKISYLSSYDPITDLPRSELYHSRLSNALYHAKHESKVLGAILLDVDRANLLREALGDVKWNILIKEITARIRSSVRFGDTLARLGTSELGIILCDLSREEDISSKVITNKILNVLSKNITVDGEELKITVSIGVAVYPNDGEDAESLIRNARAALARAKKSGGDNYVFYSHELGEKIHETLKLEIKLRKALENDEFFLYYQPKVDLRNGKISGMEALLRWQDLEGGMISPSKFIPILEESGMILELGKRVIKTACKQSNEWKKKGFPRTRISVNVTPLQFMQENFVEELAKILKREKVDPECLEIEITERTIMKGVDETIRKLKKIREMGIKISVDDFGTGYSSLSYLKRLPISTLKIDISFVREMTEDPNSLAIVNTIIALAHNLDLTVVAEGVETKEQLNMLRLLKCEEVQGYYFSPAVSAEKMGAFLSGGIPQKTIG